MRESEIKFSGDNYNFRLFGIPIGDDGLVKISAAKKLLKQMSGCMIYYTDDEIHALRSSRLGNIIKTRHNELPAAFFPQEHQTSIRDTSYARTMAYGRHRYHA